MAEPLTPAEVVKVAKELNTVFGEVEWVRLSDMQKRAWVDEAEAILTNAGFEIEDE